MSKNLQPFSWYGSKISKLDLILPNLPHTGKYIEPFGGSGAVLLNRERCDFEVFNDIDNRIVTFFEVLQNSPDRLIEKLEKTPYHEGIHEKAHQIITGDSENKLDRAWAFFVRATCGYNSSLNSGYSYSTGITRRNRPMQVSRFQYKVENLKPVAERLLNVQFMNRSAMDVVERFDGDDVVFYLDPPYPHGIRSGKEYTHEMDDGEHNELLELLLDLDGYVCLSSYANPLYDGKLNEWNTVDGDEHKLSASGKGRKCTERLYLNYSPKDESSEYQARLNN